MRMPPPQSGMKLTPAEIETLRKWIEQGAQMGIPLGLCTASPADSSGGENAIDYFVRERLKQNGLQPPRRRRTASHCCGASPTI